MKLVDLLINSTRGHPDNNAVSINGSKYRYCQLLEKVLRLAAYLKNQNSHSGKSIGILLENSFEYIVAYFAVTMAGNVIVPIDTSASSDTLEFILNDCKIETLITEKRYRRVLAKVLNHDSKLKKIISTNQINLDNCEAEFISFDNILNNSAELDTAEISSSEELSQDLAAIFYTSGSTGQPKGVMLSHRNLISNTMATIEYLKLTDSDSLMLILPFYYIYGNSLLLTHIAVGGRLEISNEFLYPEVVLDKMETEEVTGFSGVPSNFMILLNKSTFTLRTFKHLRYITQAGGSLPVPVIKQLIDTMPGKEIYIMYGQTEASPRATYLPPGMLNDKMGSIGIPLNGIKIDIVDEEGKIVDDGQVGEIVVKGDAVMLGYWRSPDEEKDVLIDGNLYTGDLAKKDSDGYIFIVGRKKEIIKSGGNRVSAKEVEEVLILSDVILEAAVVGMPDDIFGEAIIAVVVTKPDMNITEKELKKHCQVHLPSHKVPQRVVFLKSLPKHATGKVNKILLKEEL